MFALAMHCFRVLEGFGFPMLIPELFVLSRIPKFVSYFFFLRIYEEKKLYIFSSRFFLPLFRERDSILAGSVQGGRRGGGRIKS